MKNNKSPEELKNIISSCKTTVELFRKLGYDKKISDHTRSKWYKIYLNIGIDVPSFIKENNKKTYVCKQCGKIFTEKYSKDSSGDFCSRNCASKYSQSFIDKEKLSKTKLSMYNTHRKCIICGKDFIPEKTKYRRSRSLCCSSHCSQLLRYKTRRILGSNMSGGYRLHGHRKSYSGYYKGIWCDSTYELGYLIYCLDHNIDIKRCEETFEYELNGKKHKYHPDFLVDGNIIEIKGYDRGDVSAKKLSINDSNYKLLYYKDIEKEMKYVAETYDKKIFNQGQNNFYELYDEYKPLYILKCDYCGKEIKTNKKSRLKHKNHFCCLSCSGKYRAKMNHKN